MTLVVAQIADQRISLCSDSMITFGYDPDSGTFDEEKTRHVFSKALPKLLILRGDLVVGMAGEDLPWAAREVVGLRKAGVDELLNELIEFDNVDFIVAHLGKQGPRLWKVSRREVDERHPVGTAWVGDEPAYDIYRNLYLKWPPTAGLDVEFLMQSSMQGVINIFRPGFVGGYTVRVGASTEGFKFVGTPSGIFGGSPAGLGQAHGFAALTRESAEDHGGYQILGAVGQGETIGALGFVIPQAGHGWVFTHEEPWHGQEVLARSVPELVNLAEAKFGQTLAL